MIDFVDEVPHDNDILYHITETVDSQGNTAYRIELATEVTPGTPMNKVLFDSIKTDLTNLENNKLNVSMKASTSDATAGVDNTKYMTPLKVTQAIVTNYLPSKQMSVKTGTVNDGATIPQTEGYSNYVYFVSPLMDSFISKTDSNEIFGVEYLIECYVNQTTRKVTSKAYLGVQNASRFESTSLAIKANYLEIAYN